MTNTIFFVLLSFAFFLVMELVLMGAFRHSQSSKANKFLSVLCKLFLGLFIVAYLALVVLCVIVGVDLMTKGDVRQGVFMFLTAALLMSLYLSSISTQREPSTFSASS